MITLSLQGITLLFLLSRSTTGETQNYRLPHTLRPEHYDLDILANLEDPNFSFHGKITIKIKCMENTRKIVIHSYNLAVEFADARLYDSSTGSNEEIKLFNPIYDTVNEFYQVETEVPLEKDHFYLYSLKYNGTLNTNLFGFYRSSYVDSKTGSTRWLAVTQFSPIHARKAFPCFDEPGMKATFSLTLRHKASLTALSNMPVKSVQPISNEKAGFVKTEFEKTLRMSTYLVGFMVSDFTHLPPVKTNETAVVFKIWARPDALGQAEFASFIGPRLLSFLEEFFNLPYPLPKQDMVAIPDFHFNAMENWGLITFREKALLYDPNSTSAVTQHQLTFTTAHEIAHQWFGNYVTMKWWTDLWLKEGFASYLGAIAIENLFPDWNLMEHEITQELLYTFALDSLTSSHPVSVTIGNPDEIAQLFDKIPYAKGPLVIRMMNLFLGDEVFKKALSNYLKKFAYANAEKDELWAEMTKVARENHLLDDDISVKTIMDTWTVQTGYPVINVHRDYHQGTAEVSQVNPLAYTKLNDFWRDRIRKSPLDPRVAGGYPSASSPREKETSMQPNQRNDDKFWVLFNVKIAGPFRVNYDDKNWLLLTKTLKDEEKFKQINPLNRVLLVTDALSLAWTGSLAYRMALGLTSYLKHEDKFIVWTVARDHLNKLDSILRTSRYHQSFKSYMQEIVGPLYDKMGPLKLSPTDAESAQLKVVIIELAARYSLGVYVERAGALFLEAIEDNSKDALPFPKDVRRAILCTGISHSRGGDKSWGVMWSRYVSSNIASEKDDILVALGCSTDQNQLRELLHMSIDENSEIRRQDTMTVFRSVADNKHGYAVAKEFFFLKIREIFSFFGAKTAKMGDFLIILGASMHSPEELVEFKELISNNSDVFQYSSLAKNQFFEMAENNILWFNAFHDKVGESLLELKS